MNIHEQLHHAGDLEKEPLPPAEGIPKQYIPNWIRLMVKYSLLPFVLLDALAKKIARIFIKPPFQKEGSCKRRGNCCYFITMEERKGFLNRWQLFWMMEIHGFYFREKKPVDLWGSKRYIMGCRYLQKNGSCAQYKLRPQICREWPVIEVFGKPRLLKGCGYTVKATSESAKKWLEVHQDE